MAEDPVFSGMSNGDAASAFAESIAKIKSDMAAIEASAKNIEASLTKASRANIGGGSAFGAQSGGGKTGFSKGLMSSSLGAISDLPGKGRAAMFGAGAAMGGMGIGGSQGPVAGGLAFAGLPDLIDRPEMALHREASRFGMMQSTGSFSTFSNMMSVAKNNFNVQDQKAFMNTMVYGVQRAGLVGLNGGGTVGERRAAAQIGGFNTAAGLAGIDQNAVPGMMQSAYGAQAYYASMAAGVQTRDPVTGNTIGIEGQTNQVYNNYGFGRMGKEKALTAIDREFGIGSAGYQQLMEQYGNADMADTVVELMKVRAQNGGKALTENDVQDQAKDAGILGTKKSQGMERTRELESHKMDLGDKYLDDATAGIEEAATRITSAVDYLTELEGPLEKLVGAYTTMANQMDVFATELPTTTDKITKFFSGLPGLLTGLLLGGGGKGSLLGLAGRGLLALGGTAAGAFGLATVGVGAAVAGVGLAGKWAVNRYTDYDEHKGRHANESIAVNAGRGSSATPTSGYGGYAKGDWFVESDQDTRIHYGEMVLPARVAQGVRDELALGKTGSSTSVRGNGGTTVNIYLTIGKASDAEAVGFAKTVKRYLEDERELLVIGAGRLSRAVD